MSDARRTCRLSCSSRPTTNLRRGYHAALLLIFVTYTSGAALAMHRVAVHDHHDAECVICHLLTPQPTATPAAPMPLTLDAPCLDSRPIVDQTTPYSDRITPAQPRGPPVA